MPFRYHPPIEDLLRRFMHTETGRVAVLEGPSAARVQFAHDLAEKLGSQVHRVGVPAYIGETEKNLARLFEVERGATAILLFDEADALFGKRSEVKDSHDRYASKQIVLLGVGSTAGHEVPDSWPKVIVSED